MINDDGQTPSDEHSSPARKFLQMGWFPEEDRGPPDKTKELQEQLQGKIRQLRDERRHVPSSKPEKYVFEGSQWTRKRNGQWCAPDGDEVAMEQLHDFNVALLAYTDMSRHAYHDNMEFDFRDDKDQPKEEHMEKCINATNIGHQSGDQNDAGANVNATHDKARLRNYVKITPSKINTAKKDRPKNMMEAVGIGQLPVVSDEGRVFWLNTYHIPQLQNTIVSPSAIGFQYSKEFRGFRIDVDMDDKDAVFLLKPRAKDAEMVNFTLNCTNGLLWHSNQPSPSHDETSINAMRPHISALSDAAKFELWHNRLGHCGKQTLVNAHKHADGVPPLRGNAFYRCASCMQNKATKRPTHESNPLGSKKESVPANPSTSPTPTPTPTVDPSADTATSSVHEEVEQFLDDLHLPDAEPGQHFHVDHGFVRGSDWTDKDADGHTITSIDGKRSYCLIVDRATRYMWVYTATTKEPPIKAVQAILNKFKSKSTHRTVRSDQDNTLGKSVLFRAMVEEEGFVFELTGSDASKQNTRAERPHRDLGNMMRCLLQSANLRHQYWSFAIVHAAYIKNRLYHASLGMSPYEKLTGARPNLAHMKIFGSIVYAKDPGRRKAKLDHHTSRGIFLGFSATAGNCYYQDLKTNTIKLGTHVFFDEAHFTSKPGTAPLAAEALQRLGYHQREKWITPDMRLRLKADIHNKMLIEKLSSTAKIPDRSTDDSIGYDLYSDMPDVVVHPGEIELIPTGIAARAPPGSYLRVAPRSGLSIRERLDVRGGVIDPGYTGCVTVIIYNFGKEPKTIHRGDRVAQMIVELADTPEIEVVDHLPGTERQAQGFGSTETRKKPSDHNVPSMTPTVVPDLPTARRPDVAAAAKLDGRHIHALQVEMELPYQINLSFDPFDNRTSREISLKGSHDTLGMILEPCPHHARPRLKNMEKSTPGNRVARWKSELRNGYILAVNDIPVESISEVATHIKKARDAGEESVHIQFATMKKQAMNPQSGLPQLYHDQLNVIAEHLWQLHNGPEWQEEALGSIPVVDQMLEDDAFGDFMKNPSNRDLFINAIQQSPIFGKRKLTRRLLQKQDNWDKWKESEWKQLDQYEQQQTFSSPKHIRDIPPDANKLPLLWTYLIKDDGRLKARCVCNGSKKMRGSVTLGETYATSLEQTAARIFWAATAANNMITIGADASNAFAEAPPPEAPLYVWADEQYREWWLARKGEELPKGMLLRVKKALQGHPESARLWSILIDRVIKELDLQPCTHEPNLYYTGNYNGTGKKIMLLRQVDDFAISCADEATANAVIDAIDAKMSIEMKPLGRITRFNGVDVDQTRHYVKLFNATYVTKILQHHTWLNNKDYPPSTFPVPMRSDASYQRKLETADPLTPEEQRDLEHKLGFTYRQAIGELLFALVTCRPDISYATIKLSQYSTRPAKIHYEAVQQIYVYLRDTAKEGIYYWRNEPRQDLPIGPMPVQKREGDYDHHTVDVCLQDSSDILVAATDSDFAGDVSHRKSVSGVVVKLAGGAVLYKTAYQPTVACSSTEAEWTAAAAAAKHILYLRTIMDEIGMPQDEATVLFEDNQGTLLMGTAQKPTKRTRHMAVKLFALQDWIERDLLTMRRIGTSDNYSDAMSKALGRTLFYRHNDFIMGRVLPEYSRAYITGVIHSLCIAKQCIDFESDCTHLFDHDPYLYSIG